MLRLKLNHVNIRGPRRYRVSGVSEKLFYGICWMNINGRYSLIWFTSSLLRFHIQTTNILCITHIHDGVTCVQSVKLAVSDISGFSKVPISCLESWFIYKRFHLTSMNLICDKQKVLCWFRNNKHLGEHWFMWLFGVCHLNQCRLSYMRSCSSDLTVILEER